jgi:hypothetical protein
MFSISKAIFLLNIKQYIQYNATKWTRSRLYKRQSSLECPRGFQEVKVP